MDSNDKKLEKVWNKQYEKNDNTALKDNHLFELEFEAICTSIYSHVNSHKKIKVLELGCGTGFLIEKLTHHFNKLGIELLCDCVDFSDKAIDLAKDKKISNVKFYCDDFFNFLENSVDSYNFIISQRSIMAIMEYDKQTKLLNLIKKSLCEKGVGIFSECFEEQLIKLNNCREIMGLNPIEKVWHSLYLKNDQLDNVFLDVKFMDFCSTYFFVTRVIYPFFKKPIHNQDIHERAFKLPNKGDFGFLRLAIVKK